MFVWIGTYSQRGSKGIYAVEVAPKDGAMRIIDSFAADNASFLCTGPQKQLLFAVSEGGTFQGKPGGGVLSYVVSGTKLTADSAQNVQGTGSCHVTTDPTGRWLVVANYNDGTFTILPVDGSGKIGESTVFRTNPGTPGPHQNSGHAHCATFTPDGKFLYINDLGLDRICVYEFDPQKGKVNFISAADLAPGAGPRHFALHPTLPTAYGINELNSTVVVFERDRMRGTLATKQTIDTLPPAEAAARRAGTFWNACAEVQISADGKFLYGSNRGHNSLAVFAIDGATGKLSPVGHVATEGKTPRHFILLPKSDLLLVAHQDSDSIVAFRVGKDGMPVATGKTLAVPAPVCVIPLAV